MTDVASRATRDSDQLKAVLHLFNSSSRLIRFFPGGRVVGSRLRGLQLAGGMAKFLLLALQRRNAAIIHGPHLAYSAGIVEITNEETAAKAAKLFFSGNPFLPIAISKAEFACVFDQLGLDRGKALHVFLNRNHHVAIFGERRGSPCMVHFAGDDYGERGVQRHALGLEGACTALGAILGNMLPKILIDETKRGRGLLIQQRISGQPIAAEQLSPLEMESFLREALRPLREMNLTRFETYIDVSFIDAEFRKVLDHVPYGHSEITSAIEIVLWWCSKRQIRAVPVHGDYTPGNLLFSADHHLVGVIDWEWFWLNGCPGLDALQILFTAEAHLQKQTVFAVIAAFLKERRISSSLSTFLPIIGRMYGLSNDDLWHVAVLLWLRLLWMGCVVTIPNSTAWFERAITTPAAAIPSASDRAGTALADRPAF